MQSEQILRLALSGDTLTDSQRVRLIPVHLFEVAKSGKLKLTQGEKDRLDGNHLTELAIAGLIELSERDLEKLNADQKTLVASAKQKRL